MERQLKQYNKDYMKMAMLKQEETFRQQVHELHRLYRVQRLLMNGMKADIRRQRNYSMTRTELDKWNTKIDANSPCCYQNQRRAHRAYDLELPAEQYINGKDNGVTAPEIEEESDLELTLATGSRRQRKNDHSFTSDSGGSFSSSSTESGSVKVNCDSWGLFQAPDVMNIGSYHIKRSGGFSAKEQISEEKVDRPPWLFECMSLNMA